MCVFERATGHRCRLIPNAANLRWLFPARPDRRYTYDIVYLGTYLQKKRRMFDEVLHALARDYKTGVFGPYWTAGDKAPAVAQKVLRRLGLPSGARLIDQVRIAMNPQQEGWLYSSAGICVNFREREPDGSQPHYIVNQRAFKIPACGGFQVCDYVPALRRYFEEDEVVMASGPEDWFAKIRHYLENDEGRREIQRRGTARALRDHTYHNRVRLVTELYARAMPASNG